MKSAIRKSVHPLSLVCKFLPAESIDSEYFIPDPIDFLEDEFAVIFLKQLSEWHSV